MPFHVRHFTMRLSASQIETIRDAAQQNFGAEASVWLFGSRVDDTKRGGDVDLYVESPQKNTLQKIVVSLHPIHVLLRTG